MKDHRHPRSWSVSAASLLPLWLLALAVSAEGFPPAPISVQAAMGLFLAAVAIAMLLLWKKWIGPAVVLSYNIPFAFLYLLDEISTVYKTPFILVCTLIVSVGILLYQRSGRLTRGWALLAAAALVSLAVAAHSAGNFWQMTDRLGYYQCFPDALGCPPLAGRGDPWWLLIVSL